MPDFENQAIQERLIQEVKEMVESGNPQALKQKPILLAAEPSKRFKRVLDYGDGWFPVIDTNNTAAIEQVPRLRECARAIGRDPDAIEVSMYIMCAPDEDLIRRCASGGAQRVVLLMEPAPRPHSRYAVYVPGGTSTTKVAGCLL